MAKFKNEVLCEWKDSDGTEYLDLVINDDEGCLVVKENDRIYLMNGKQVYSAMDGADYPGRDMTEAEYEEIIAWAKQYFESKGEPECITNTQWKHTDCGMDSCHTNLGATAWITSTGLRISGTSGSSSNMARKSCTMNGEMESVENFPIRERRQE